MILLIVGKILGTAVQKIIYYNPGLKKNLRGFDSCWAKTPKQENLSLTQNKGLIEKGKNKFL